MRSKPLKVGLCATGDSVEDASGRKTSAPLAARILVATYEKFLGCLSVGGPPRDLTDACIICDEVQLIGDPTRGRHVELLLTLLRKSGWMQLVIESCGRLCVVDVSDLTEAILRVREGTLTREGLFNWLTTPGIALREDIPPPV